jgi:hypothetical protein
MRILFLAFVLLFSVVSTEALSQTSGEIKASIKIATLKSGCTSGIGFRCGGSISGGIKHTLKAANEIIAHLHTEDNQTLVMAVDQESGVLPEGAEQYFSGETFTLEEDWAVQPEFTEGMGHEEGTQITVKAGTYPLTISEGKYIIRYTY